MTGKNLVSGTNNKKPLRHYIKSWKQDNNGISALKDPINGHIVTDPVEKANTLNQQFHSVFTSEHNNDIPEKTHLCFLQYPLLKSLNKEFITCYVL